MPVNVAITQQGDRYLATVDGGAPFEVARRVTYKGASPTVGLSNLKTPGAKYDAAAYRAQFGFWADFIVPTCMAESNGAFNCLNTYDRAFFTFTFLQYAAHVPNGDFVKYFRLLLAEPEAADYFPDLSLRNGRIWGAVQLENDTTTQPLMTYFNPSVQDVETAEAINAAKMVHWCEHAASHREIQVRCGVEHFKAAMQSYSKRYQLDGRLDQVCLVVADIRHQGRGSSQEILTALATGGDENLAYRNLLDIGRAKFPQRIATIEREVVRLQQAGILGSYLYNDAQGDFIRAMG
ncbi:MAG: hypothetical protein HYZ37_12700 [Candidatus Solibacter usitatus]|nr:hypothetical protein [Candidatus Solibacter usitatus]